MATQKTRSNAAAAAHVFVYTLPFLFLTLDPWALAVIAATHFAIDRWRLARFVVWLKNGARGPITATGYPDEVPPWLAGWLTIIADNLLHILINGAALKWLA